jgi:hypothetical protein
MAYSQKSKSGFLTDANGNPSSIRATLWGGFGVSAIIALSGVFIPSVDRVFALQMVMIFVGAPTTATVTQKIAAEKKEP